MQIAGKEVQTFCKRLPSQATVLNTGTLGTGEGGVTQNISIPTVFPLKILLSLKCCPPDFQVCNIQMCTSMNLKNLLWVKFALNEMTGKG